MADSGKRKLNHCAKCKIFFMGSVCPRCKTFCQQEEYDEQFRDLQGIPEEYRAELRKQPVTTSKENNKDEEAPHRRSCLMELILSFGVYLLIILACMIILFLAGFIFKW